VSELLSKGRRRVSTLTAESLVFTYPLVIMALTRQHLTTRGLPGGLLAPINAFAHLREFPSPPLSPIVTPNRDTLYSSAWLDLTGGPLTLIIPDTGRRFSALPMYDAWTHVFATPGSHTDGSCTEGSRAEGSDGSRRFLIRGPHSPAAPSTEEATIHAPTNMVWILGRLQTNGVDDYPTVHALQERLQIRPMTAPGRRNAGPTGGPQLTPPSVSTPYVSTPAARVARMDPREYFGTAAMLMATNPARPTDAPVVSRMAQLGLAAGRSLSGMLAEPQADQHVARGMRDAMAQIEAAGRNPPTVVRNNWIFPRSAEQNAPEDYLTRAGAAWAGVGAMPPSVGVEATTMVDAEGRPLTGEHRYVIHFAAADATPPVRAFWSVSVREPRPLFVDLAGHGSIGDRDPLRHNIDGSLDIFVQQGPPEGPQTTNWLRTPRAAFHLVLRLYAPLPTAVSGTWCPPPVTRRP
jgi:hypothetical protein